MRITPVHSFGGWWAKREDLACYTDDAKPSGSKMRQYLHMAGWQPQGTPMIVGCSAHSAMQIYVAAAAVQCKTRAIVYVPQRKEMSDATKWAMNHGAEVNFVHPPAYPSIYRKAARERAIKEGGSIKWNPQLAVDDAAMQVQNLPSGTRRILVPTGSGLTVAGVIIGLKACGYSGVKVVAIAVSDLCNEERIRELVQKFKRDLQGHYLKKESDLKLIRTSTKYEAALNHVQLPDKTILDPYYAAKAMEFVQTGDCLWVPGRRPVM